MKNKRKKNKLPDWEDEFGYWGLTKNGIKVGVLKPGVKVTGGTTYLAKEKKYIDNKTGKDVTEEIKKILWPK